MKVIFLDIDGVLNSEKFAKYCYENREFVENGGSNWVDPYPVLWVLQLCQELDLKIVLSSSWRLWDLNSTIDELNKYRDLKPLIPYLVGVTPRNMDDRIWEDRGDEIQYYLDKHPEIENYCIIDDDNDMLESQKEYFIRTNSACGLTPHDCNKIRKIFNLTK